MAMRLLDKESFEQELRKAGLKPTGKKSDKGRVWKTDDGKVCLVPDIEEPIPDSILETVLREVGRLYRQ